MGKRATAQTEGSPSPPLSVHSLSPSLQQEAFIVFSLNLARPSGPYWQSRARGRSEVCRADWGRKQFLSSSRTPAPQEAVTSPPG